MRWMTMKTVTMRWTVTARPMEKTMKIEKTIPMEKIMPTAINGNNDAADDSNSSFGATVRCSNIKCWCEYLIVL